MASPTYNDIENIVPTVDLDITSSVFSQHRSNIHFLQTLSIAHTFATTRQFALSPPDAITKFLHQKFPLRPMAMSYISFDSLITYLKHFPTHPDEFKPPFDEPSTSCANTDAKTPPGDVYEENTEGLTLTQLLQMPSLTPRSRTLGLCARPVKLSCAEPLAIGFKHLTGRGWYLGYELKCTVVDEPCFGLSAIEVLVEDAESAVGLVTVLDLSRVENRDDLFGFGSVFHVKNPVFDGFRVCVKGRENLRFEDRLDWLRCRICGQSGCVVCPGCKQVWYCSDECREYDWNRRNHFWICSN